jgi:fatty acid amide hydrolase 2
MPEPGRLRSVSDADATLGSAGYTHQSASQLAAAIRSGSARAVDVIEAHIAVLERTAWCNALAAQRFDIARAEAAEADRLVATTDPDALPPWHGVPITIKEMIAVAGMPNTGGMWHRRGRDADTDAPAVARLRAAGVIILGVGNTPGPVPWIETNNVLYGRTSNAYDRRRTAGGSSGGDGAIVGSGGAPVALGSDMGGSVRIPAFVNGVFGHLPSPGLVPLTGHYPVPQGAFHRTLTMGPLARRAEDLMPVLRFISGPDGKDDLVIAPPELGDDTAVSIRGLGVHLPHGATVVPTRGVIQQRIDDAAAALSAAGAVVVETDLRRLRYALTQFAAVAVAELDVYTSLVGIGGDPAPRLLMVPALVMRAVESAPVRLVRTRAARRLVDAAERTSDQLADILGGGVLLYPPFPRVAPRHRTTTGQPWLVTNTAVFNLLGMPATQVPLGLNTAGLPLGVQVVAAAGNDHVTIAVARELERAFGGWVDPAQVVRGTR